MKKTSSILAFLALILFSLWSSESAATTSSSTFCANQRAECVRRCPRNGVAYFFCDPTTLQVDCECSP